MTSMDEVHKIIPALMELRPHRTEAQLGKLLKEAHRDGYRIAYIGNDELAFSVLGFRILTFIFSGKTLKVDDLVTLPGYKHNGFAGKLFEWVIDFAKKEQCDHISLDSGFTRHEAHRFYLNHGLRVESLHFGSSVEDLRK